MLIQKKTAYTLCAEVKMNFLTSAASLFSGGILGITFSLLSVTAVIAVWALVLMILHPLHASLAVISGLFEYFIIKIFGISPWLNFFSFFICYIVLLVIYTVFIRRLMPLPGNISAKLEKLCTMKDKGYLSDEEFKAAKKQLLKL